MFFQPIFLSSKHPIDWQVCLEVVATYLEAHAIQLHHLTPTTAGLELTTLTYPTAETNWVAIASMLEQDFMTAITIIIGKPEAEQSSWERQKNLLSLPQTSQQSVISFEQLIVESTLQVSTPQFTQLLEPIAQSLTTESIETIQAICHTNLNLSQAAKALFIHRNTLNYRIEKIILTTGIDVRSFAGAMTLYLASKRKH